MRQKGKLGLNTQEQGMRKTTSTTMRRKDHKTPIKTHSKSQSHSPGHLVKSHNPSKARDKVTQPQQQ